MFDIGFSEVLLIFVIALIVLGPEKLPRLASQVGRWIGRARAMARQFREQLEEEVNLEQVRRAHETKPQKPPEQDAGTTTTASAAGNTPSGASADSGSSGIPGTTDPTSGATGDGSPAAERSARESPVGREPPAGAASPTTGLDAGHAAHGYSGPDPADFRADTFSHAHPTNEYGANPLSTDGGANAPTASEANVAAAQSEPPAEAQQHTAKPEVYASNTPPAPERADTHGHS
jgi:sec-independent protein translocase protein TatB